MNAALVVKDALFSRMLELELKSRGVSSENISSYEKAAKLPFSYIFVDESAYRRETRLVSSCEVVIICEDNTGEHDYDFPFYVRPFRIQQMLDETLGLLSQTYDSINSAKRTSEGLKLHGDTQSVAYRGERIHLSKKEYLLLKLLVDKDGEIVSREEASAIFDEEENGATNVVDVYINYLRNKLDHHFDVKIIQSVRGKGYCILNK